MFIKSDSYYEKKLSNKQKVIDKLIAENNDLRSKLSKCDYEAIKKEYKNIDDTRIKYEVLIDELNALKQEYIDINEEMRKEKTALMNDLRSLEKLY